MNHFAEEVLQHTSYADEKRLGSPGQGRDGRSASLYAMATMNDLRESDSVKVPSLSTQESEKIRSVWQRKQNNLNTIFWLEIDGDPLNPVRADRKTVAQRCLSLARDYCTDLVPTKRWCSLLNKETIKADVIAGASVAMMIIPQSMSYANIAGLSVQYGLYASVVPLIAYAFLGTSRQLAVGPVAMVSLLTEVGLNGQLDHEDCPALAAAEANNTLTDDVNQSDICPEAYAELAILTSMMVGVFQVVASFLQLGFLVSFLGHPVVSGFTSGAAIIIGLSQLKDFMGYSIPKSQYVYETLGHLFDKIDQTNYKTLLMGLTWWFMLWAARQLALKKKKYCSWLRPCAPLIVCTLGIVVGGTWEDLGGCSFSFCKPDEKQKYLVGTIPSGFPPFSLDSAFRFSKLSKVLSTSISAAVIGYMESIAIAKSLGAKHKYEVVPGQELFALGVANILGSLTSAYPITGSFSRSAVNNTVGAKTNLSGMVTGLLVMCILLVLTEPFKFLPKFCLAAIVISSVTNLVDYKECRHLWHVKKPDCLLWVLAFFGTLFLGVQNGLLGAIVASLVIVIYESVRPQISVLWRLPETPIYRNIKQESLGQFIPGVLIVRLGASMYFANVAYIRDHIWKMVSDFSSGALLDTPVEYVVMEMTPVISIDSTALHMLVDMHRDLRERGIRICFATVGNRVESTLERSGFLEKLGRKWLRSSVHEAVQHCIRHKLKMGSNSGAKGRLSDVLSVTLEEEGEEEEPQSEADPNSLDDRGFEGSVDLEASPAVPVQPPLRGDCQHDVSSGATGSELQGFGLGQRQPLPRAEGHPSEGHPSPLGSYTSAEDLTVLKGMNSLPPAVEVRRAVVTDAVAPCNCNHGPEERGHGISAGQERELGI